MKYTVQFFYGCNYACPEGDDVEHFDTLSAIGRALQDRSNDAYYPSAEPEALVWIGTSDDVTDQYPDRRVFLGPRGGVRIELA